MKKYLSISIASILVLSIAGIAKASFTITSAIGGVPTVSGATLETFNEATPSILALSGSAWLKTGGDNSTYMPPYFSGSTAAFFGESPTSGLDSTQYTAVRTGGSATLSFSTPEHYFGVFWGTIDTNEGFTFYDSANNVIGTVLGKDIPGIVLNDGTWSQNSAAYVNVTSTAAFSRVVGTSLSTLEFDDVAYSQVPEPATLVLLGTAGTWIFTRKKH